MKGSFLIKASDLLTKGSIFNGAVVLKIDGIEYLEKGVLFLTPKGFNIRFLFGQECVTVYLGNKFDSVSLKCYKDQDLTIDNNTLLCFNFDLGKYKEGRNNYYFTEYFYPANKISFYYESSLSKKSLIRIKEEVLYGFIENNGSFRYIFDANTLAQCINFSEWSTTKISKAHKEKGLAKVDQALQVNVQHNTNKYNTLKHDSV